MAKQIKDPTKSYDANDAELTPGDEVTITGVYMDQAKTDAGASIRIRLHATNNGYSPVIAVHESQCTKTGE